MALTALEIVSLDRMRLELRFPEDDHDHDDFIKELIKSAVDFVAADLGVPLLDIEVYKNAIPDGNFLIIKDEFAKDLLGIRNQGQDFIEGYFPNVVDSKEYLVDSPAVASWIEGVIVATGNWVAGNVYRVIYTRGIKDEEISKYKSLIVLLVRSAYNGESMSNPNSAYERMKVALVNRTYTGLK